MSKRIMVISTWMLWCFYCPLSVKAQSERNGVTLSQMDKGKHRIFLVFAPDSQNEFLLEQTKMLRQAHLGLTDRDMLVVQVIANNVEISPPVKEELPVAAALREEYKVKPDQFTVILVGKDGGEKYRATHAQAPAVLFEIIDAMPMRQNEWHEKRNE